MNRARKRRHWNSVEVETIHGLGNAGFATSAHGMRISDMRDGDGAGVDRATCARGAAGNSLSRVLRSSRTWDTLRRGHDVGGAAGSDLCPKHRGSSAAG